MKSNISKWDELASNIFWLFVLGFILVGALGGLMYLIGLLVR